MPYKVCGVKGLKRDLRISRCLFVLLYYISFVCKKIGIIVLPVRKKKKNIQKVIFPRIKKYSKYKKDYDIAKSLSIYRQKKSMESNYFRML